MSDIKAKMRQIRFTLGLHHGRYPAGEAYSSPLALDIEIYTASRGFLATARFLLPLQNVVIT